MTLSYAIICANGLGDALLMMILGHALYQKGFQVDIYHPKHADLQELFPKVHFKALPPKEDFVSAFSSYETIYIQNDNSETAWHFLSLRQQKKLSRLCFLFPKRKALGHKQGDYVFNPQYPFATNLSIFCEKTLHLKKMSKENGFFLSHKNFRQHPQRIIIHPTSQDPKRNWKKSQFLKLAFCLKKLHYHPVFIVGEHEHSQWQKIPFPVKTFKSLKELSCYIQQSGYLIGNDSGLGHIASNCLIPTLTISGNRSRVKMWRPDFAMNILAIPSLALPNFKGINFLFRENYWQYFVSVRKVLRRFKQLKKMYTP